MYVPVVVLRVSCILTRVEGLYCCDTSTPIMEFTAEEARKAAALAIDAAKKLMSGEKLIYSLCRPPGHHAAQRAYLPSLFNFQRFSHSSTDVVHIQHSVQQSNTPSH